MKKILPDAPKSPIKFWSIIIAVPIVFILTVVFMLLYEGSTKGITDVASQFNPGPGWKLESKQVEPPRIVCLNSVPCPSVHETWTTNDDITKKDFVYLLNGHAEELELEGDCARAENVSGVGVAVCSASGLVDGYDMEARIIKSASNNKTTLAINLR